MPAIKQRSSSRGFTIQFGKVDKLEINLKTKKEITARLVELATPLAETGFGITPGTTTVDLGTPGLRTVWKVQTIALNFSAFVQNPSEKSEQTVNLNVAILVGGQVEDVTLIQFKVPKAKNDTIGEFGELLVPQKLYILELYAPIVVSHGQQATLQLSLASAIPNPEENEGEVFLWMIEPVVNVMLEQMFPA